MQRLLTSFWTLRLGKFFKSSHGNKYNSFPSATALYLSSSHKAVIDNFGVFYNWLCFFQKIDVCCSRLPSLFYLQVVSVLKKSALADESALFLCTMCPIIADILLHRDLQETVHCTNNWGKSRRSIFTLISSPIAASEDFSFALTGFAKNKLAMMF